MVGHPSNKIEYRAWEVGIYAIPLVATIKTLVAPYRFIKTNTLLVRLAGLISTPREFVCLRNNDSSFLKIVVRAKSECRVGKTRQGLLRLWQS